MQNITMEGNGYRITGISKIKWPDFCTDVYILLLFSEGPLAEEFSYKLTPDNKTVAIIDLGILGGDRLTTAEFVDENTLVSYCKDPDTGIVDVIATRTIFPNNPDIMYFKTKDVLEGHHYETVSAMIRQKQ